MLRQFEGRLAFVTGGASGIGLAIGKALADAGMKVALTDIDREALKAAAGQIPGTLTIALDVRDRKNWAGALDEAEAAAGPLAVLVSNAGVAGSRLPLAETSVEGWEWTRAINLDGMFHALSLGVPRLIASGQPGHVVATASLGAFIPMAGNGVYGATKAAVVALCEALRLELAETQVGVSVLCPGIVRTALVDSNAARAPGGIAIGEREPELEEAMRQGLDPAHVGRLVVDAIAARNFWIFTHPELHALVTSRNAEIDAATH